MNWTSVDSAERLGEGLVYGDAPVANLQLECEALFMRSWTVPLMPPAVKQSLGITEQAPTAPGAPADQPQGQPAPTAPPPAG